MTKTIKPSLKVTGVYENNTGLFNMQALSNALQVSPSEISKAMIWGAGQYYTEDFAISRLTEGVNHMNYIETYDYQYPVMLGDLDAMEAVAVVPASTSNVGIGFQKFRLKFRSRQFKRQNIIISPSKVQCRVVEHPTPDGKYYEYVLERMGNNPAGTMPVSDLQVGALWERGPSPVEFEDSVGVETEEVYPGRAKNQISALRSSMKWSGHIAKKTIAGGGNERGQFDKAVFKIPSAMKDGSTKEFRYWLDWKEWQFFMKFRRYKEIDLWISEYNKLPNGDIAQKGPSGMPIPRGDGILNQLTNTGTYSGKLTARRLEGLATELFYGVSGAENKHIQLHTGTLGMRVFTEAMQDQLKSYFTTEQTQNTFVTKNGDKLTLGAYFNTYKTRDGHTITVHKNPVFDLIYKNSPKYEGIPSFSGTMVFLDMSTYNNVPNVQMVTRKGRELVRKVVAGIATLPDQYGDTQFVATDKDRSSVEYLFEQGVNIMDVSSCYKLDMVTSSYYL